MKLKGEQLLPVTRDRVWAALLDTGTLRQAIPGCESMTDEGDGLYLVKVLATVGPVKARFKARLTQMEVHPPERYSLAFEGDGGVAGVATGTAEIELREVNDGAGTILAYNAQAKIGGRLAQIGSRLVDAAAERMSKQFFEGLIRLLSAPEESPATPTTLTPSTPVDLSMVPSSSLSAVDGSPVPVARGAAWGGTVSLTMPAWAWAFSVVTISVLAGWISTL